MKAIRVWAVCAALAASCAVRASSSHAAAASVCTPSATRTALASFVAAFNRGSYGRLDALFAAPPLFRWYSSNAPGPRTTTAAHERDTLIAYFRVRHRKRDRLRLAGFTFTANSNGYGNFVFRMRRSAADYRRGAWFGLIGKGAVVCSDQATEPLVQLIVVSLGGANSDKH